MRHLGSVFLALVLAPVIWGLTGIGVSKFAEAGASSSELNVDLSVGLAAVLGAGFCYSLLVLPRLSPLGPVLTGLGFLGLTGWRLWDLPEFTRFVPDDLLDVSSAGRYPAEGYAALLAVPLLGTIFSARRWRRFGHPPGPPVGSPGEHGAGTAAAYQEYPPGYGYPPATGHPAAPYSPAGQANPPSYGGGYPPYGSRPPYGGHYPPYDDEPTDPTLPLPDDPEATRHR